MAGINIPKRQQDNSGQLLSTIGTIAGTAMGGPAGGAAGGLLGGMMAPKPTAGPEAVSDTGGAFQRRMQELDNDPLSQIRQGLQAVQQIPDPQQRASLAAPLLQADYIARNKA